jgi:hypothetical protein
MKNRSLSDEALQMISHRFAVLAEPMRLRLVHALFEGEKNVTQLVEAAGIFRAATITSWNTSCAGSRAPITATATLPFRCGDIRRASDSRNRVVGIWIEPAAGHEPLDRLGAIRRASRNCIRVVGRGIEPAAGHEQAALGRRVEWLPGLGKIEGI